MAGEGAKSTPDICPARKKGNPPPTSDQGIEVSSPTFIVVSATAKAGTQAIAVPTPSISLDYTLRHNLHQMNSDGVFCSYFLAQQFQLKVNSRVVVRR